MLNIDKFRQMTKKHRLDAGYTQAELAEKLFISTKFLSEIEAGSNIPSTETVISLLNFFNLSLHEYLEGSVSKHNLEKDSIYKELNQVVLNVEEKEYLLELAEILNNGDFHNGL